MILQLTNHIQKKNPKKTKALFSNQAIKSTLTNFIKVSYIDNDLETKILPITDVSSIALNAVIEQEVNFQHNPIGFFSIKLTSTKSRYSTFSQELLAIYQAIKHFYRHFMYTTYAYILCTPHFVFTAAID